MCKPSEATALRVKRMPFLIYFRVKTQYLLKIFTGGVHKSWSMLEQLFTWGKIKAEGGQRKAICCMVMLSYHE